VVDGDAGGEALPAWKRRVVTAGVDDHLGPQRRQVAGQFGDVDVLPAGVGATEEGEGAGVLGHQGDAKPPFVHVISSRSRSHSVRKRDRSK
jgi:hypothetical protein